LNETYGMNLTEDDRVDLGRIQEKLEADAELKSVMNPNNSLDNIRIKFNETVDALVLEFVNTKLGLYKKLTEPKANEMLKAKWFEGYRQQHQRYI
jgi:type I restriction enzyme, R subunit